MNREIKFRGQIIDSKEWVYGNLVKIDNGQCFIFNFHFIPAMSCPSEKFIEVKPETIGQFVGILDKANTEIYEGDFISTDLQRPYNKVIFKNGAFMVECFDDNLYHDIFFPTSHLQHTFCKYSKVIGNVIDNPELDGVPS